MTQSTDSTSNEPNLPQINADKSFTRRIKSFVRRQGRLSQAQKLALESQWPTFGLELKPEKLDLETVFGRQSDTILEIGFGMGTSLAKMAENNPNQNYIGIEVHRPGVGALLKLVEEKQLTNIRVYNDDAIEVLAQCIPENSLKAVYLFFPDPWHKKRHHKRRIVQPEFAKMIAKHLRPEGQFHMATDWQNYAEHMMTVLTNEPGYKNISGHEKYHPRPKYRPLTKFEQRGHRLGHGVWDLIFEKVNH